MKQYSEFLATKLITSRPVGFDIKRKQITPSLFDFQKDIVEWSLRCGRAAIFAGCGLGKTFMQLEWARHIMSKQKGRCLILAPLGVVSQTVDEGEKIGVEVHACRSEDEMRDGINITNY